MTDALKFRVAYGSCTWPHGSTRITAYVLTKDGNGKPVRVFPHSVMAEDGRPTVQNAALNVGGGSNGVWNFASFEHQEGTMLLVQLSTTKHGSPWCDAARVIRLRSEAPLIQIRGKTIIAHGNALPSVNCFHGRGDILTPREANQFGAGLTLNFIEKFLVNQDEIDEAFDEHLLLDGLSNKPKVVRKKIAGKEHVIVEDNRKRRKIKLRK